MDNDDIQHSSEMTEEHDINCMIADNGSKTLQPEDPSPENETDSSHKISENHSSPDMARSESSAISQSGQHRSVSNDINDSNELKEQKSENKSCIAPGCGFLSDSDGNLVLHLHTHFKFDVARGCSIMDESKFSLVSGKYQCLLCPLVTPHRPVFVEHLRHHLLSHPYQCGHCSKSMSSVTQLHSHTHEAHPMCEAQLSINSCEALDGIMFRIESGCEGQVSVSEDNLSQRDKENSTVDEVESKQTDLASSDIKASSESSSENTSSDSKSSPTLPKKQEPEPVTPSKPAVQKTSSKFKYLVTAEGKFSCLECKTATSNSVDFTKHIFEDIHQALRNTCHECGLKGKLMQDGKVCPIVEKIIKALIRQKETALAATQVKKESGLGSNENKAAKMIQNGSNASNVTNGIASDETSNVSGKVVDNEVLKSEGGRVEGSFNETMALLKNLSDPINDGANQFNDKSGEKCSEISDLNKDGKIKKSREAHENSAKVVTEVTADKEAVVSEEDSSKKNVEKKDEERKTVVEKTNENTASIATNKPTKEGNENPEKNSPTKEVSNTFPVSSQENKSQNSIQKLIKSEKVADGKSPQGSPSGISYRCGIQNCSFETKDDVCFKLHHMTKHPNTKNTCAVCKKEFDDEDTLVSHWNTEHKVTSSAPLNSHNDQAARSQPSAPVPTPPAASRGTYPCVVTGCEAHFNRIPELSSHLDQRHPDHATKLPCCFCFLVFKNRTEFTSHVQSHVKNIAKCSYCPGVYDNKEGLLAHIAADHEGRPRRINICIKILNNERENGGPSGAKAGEVGNKAGGSGLIKGAAAIKIEKSAASQVENSAQSLTKRRRNPSVEIVMATVAMSEKCSHCTFTCNTPLQLKLHTYECHEKQTGGSDPSAPFSCRYCKLSTDVKDTLRRHLAHHTGKHVVRYYTCPYCTKQSNQMTIIEDHITSDHPDDVFKFEVVQDTINYLDDMVTCPVCSGSFPWKPDFLNHLGSVHRLEMVAGFIEKSNFEKPSPSGKVKIPRSLFKDLLPPVGDDEGVEEGEEEEEEVVGESLAPLEGRKEGSKNGMIDRYHCDRCDFSCNDMEGFQSHQALHRRAGDNSYQSERSSSPEEMDTSAYAHLDPHVLDKYVFKCQMCPFICRKKLNLQRHLMIHERTEMMTDGYRCGHCEFRHDRLNCIKFHLGKYHMNEPRRRMFRIVNGVEEKVDPDNEIMKVKGTPSVPSAAGDAALQFDGNSRKSIKPSQKWVPNWAASASNRLQKMARYGGMAMHSRYQVNRFGGGAIMRRQVRAGDMRISADYMESTLPPGMIYAEPMKCPKCDFTNRVRINLVRHMRMHDEEENAAIIDEGLGQSGGATSEYTERNWDLEEHENMNQDEGAYFGNVSIKHESGLHSPRRTSLSSAQGSCDRPGSASVTPQGVKQEFMDDDDEMSGSYAASLSPMQGEGSVEDDSLRRVFKCAYCPIISKWNRRDISLHVLHVHMNRRVYGCGYCPYGTSKTSAIIMRHCMRAHPNKAVSVRDDLETFNSIVPLSKDGNVIPVGYLKPDGQPIWEVEELNGYLAAKDGILFDMSFTRGAASSARSSSSSRQYNREDPTRTGTKRSYEDVRDVPVAKSPRMDQPLDLSQGFNMEMQPANNINMPALARLDGWTWQCRLCGFQNQRPIRVRNHIVCHHLRLKPYRCPHCNLYLWKSQVAVAHIHRLHPGLPAVPASTSVEKKAYLDRNMVKIHLNNIDVNAEYPAAASTPSNRPVTYNKSKPLGLEKPLGPDGLPLDIPRNPDGTPRSAFYRCKLCSYQESRHDKTKYHIIKQHLKIGLFSCPYCEKYMWGRQYVERHIQELHPGMEMKIKRTFEEYDEYLRSNIQKIGGMPTIYTRQNNQYTKSPALNELEETDECAFKCEFCPYSAPTEMLLASHRRMHISFECCYCDFRHSLAAKVQSHCLSRHPSEPVKYKKCQDEKSAEGAVVNGAAVVVKSEFGGGSARRNDGDMDIGLKARPDEDDDADLMEMYMCRYCQQIMWSIEDMQQHLKDTHPAEPPEFELIQPGSQGRRGGLGDEDDDDDGGNAGNLSVKSYQSFNPASLEPTLVNLCTLCSYSSVKLSPMRHHIMSHLHYRPFSCPYCDKIHSVKSSPVLKHVRLRHPSQPAKFVKDRDEEMERKVRGSYRRVSIAEAEAARLTMPPPPTIGGSHSSLSHPASMANRPHRSDSGEPQKQQRRAFYKCPFCSLVTQIRTDMRHHLMREMHYKPFTCAYCAYTEPSRSGMGKHFRSKHCGMVVDIKDLSDPAMDEKVEAKLSECLVKGEEEIAALELNKPTPKPSPQKNKPKKNSSYSKPAFSSFIEPEKTWSTTKSRTVKMPSLMPSLHSSSGKLLRCPHCTYSSMAPRPLQAHMITHSPYRLQCGYCDHRSHYPSWIRKHIRNAHPSKGFKYREPSSTFNPSSQVFMNHEDDGESETVPPISTMIPEGAETSFKLEDLEKMEEEESVKLEKIEKPATAQQQKHNGVPAVLDGVPLNITIEADEDGMFRCKECDYVTATRAHFKLHSVIHQPRKWKCYYCGKLFPLIFRLRRHCAAKHPSRRARWIDVTTRVVYDDTTPRARPSSNAPSPADSESPRSSALKRRRVVMDDDDDGASSDHTVNYNDDVNDDIDDDEDDNEGVMMEVRSDRSGGSSRGGGRTSSELAYCCHICPQRFSSSKQFADHLLAEHARLPTGKLPAVEILPEVDGEDELMLRRCGFCSFESFSRGDFDSHVREHTDLVPQRCSVCTFASFDADEVAEHVTANHSGEDIAAVIPLDGSYTMTAADEETENATVTSPARAQKAALHFNPIVRLLDVDKVAMETRRDSTSDKKVDKSDKEEECDDNREEDNVENEGVKNEGAV